MKYCRHEAVQKMLLINPEYKSPTDYRSLVNC